MTPGNFPFDQIEGQTWAQICQLVLAGGLSSLIGVERELQNKAAGLRTNTLVGIGAALFMQISKFGFFDVLRSTRVVLDPSRIAAQVVSGIGFIGGGIIFRQKSEIRGLTTAAAIWLSAAVGAACGAGLPILASSATLLYFITVLIYPSVWRFLAKRLNLQGKGTAPTVVRYHNWSGALERILDALNPSGSVVLSITRLEEIEASGQHGYRIYSREEDEHPVSDHQVGSTQSRSGRETGQNRIFDVHLRIENPGSTNDLACTLSQLDCVISVSIVRDQMETV